MGWSEQEIFCMKHPNYKQKPGICSCCLNEKLSNILGGPTIFTFSPSNISSSPNNYHYYSSGSSSPSHSRRRRGNHHRTASDGLKPSFDSSSGRGGDGGLKKSRSVAVIVNGKKKKQGFWSKFIKSTTGKRAKEGYVHPRMNEDQ